MYGRYGRPSDALAPRLKICIRPSPARRARFVRACTVLYEYCKDDPGLTSGISPAPASASASAPAPAHATLSPNDRSSVSESSSYNVSLLLLPENEVLGMLTVQSPPRLVHMYGCRRVCVSATRCAPPVAVVGRRFQHVLAYQYRPTAQRYISMHLFRVHEAVLLLSKLQ